VEARFRAAYGAAAEAVALPADEELGWRVAEAWRTEGAAHLDDSVCMRIGAVWPVVVLAEVRPMPACPSLCACMCARVYGIVACPCGCVLPRPLLSLYVWEGYGPA
jgi:hypothetical protein